jgi:Rrf2 family transcriptional regulator, iron-sulfur cluster assembly transcription factor
MTLLFSRQCEYALQAMVYLAKKPAGTTISIKELSGRLEIPYHYLGKILQSLTHRGMLTSNKGRNGGFALSTPIERITLTDIIGAIDGSSVKHDCIMGFKECSEENPCALHNDWVHLRTGLFHLLDQKSLQQVAGEMKKQAYLDK